MSNGNQREVREIDPNAIVMALGSIDIQGVMDGTFVEIEAASNLWETHVGGQGEVTRVKNPDETALITFTLAQSSPTNDDLTKLVLADKANNTGKRSIKIRDLNGTSSYSGAVAWIEKWPKVGHGKDTQPRQWAIRVARLVWNVGGNVSA